MTVTTPCDCGETVHLSVCKSAAGFYLGFYCDVCGPLQRISNYYVAEKDAIERLEGITG